MPKKKKSRKKSRTGKAGIGQSIKVLLGVLFLIGFLILSLFLLARLRQTLQGPRPQVHAPAHIVGPKALLEEVRAEVENALLRSGASLEKVSTRATGVLLRFEIRGQFPPAETLEDLARRLRQVSPALRLKTHRAEGEVTIFYRRSVLGLILFQPPAPSKKPRLAIIVDDMGDNLAAAQQLLAIDLPLTFSVLPEEPDTNRIATLIHARGHEVMIHIPMEPLAYPRISPGRNALYVNLSAAEIRRRFADYLKKVPFAVGCNNHMGSRFTESRRGMKIVAALIKKAGLFFIDSLTTPRSVAFAEVRRDGVPAAVRDRFLDNVQDVDRISAQIRSLAELALRQGHAIGICHPHPATIAALRREAPFLRHEGIDLVPVSQLLIR